MKKLLLLGIVPILLMTACGSSGGNEIEGEGWDGSATGEVAKLKIRFHVDSKTAEALTTA